MTRAFFVRDDQSGFQATIPFEAETDSIRAGAQRETGTLTDVRSSRMETTAAWRAMFESWPDAIPREGMVVTSFGEAIPFQAFMISGGLLLLERDKPDQFGTRKVIVSYDQICAIRLPTPMDLSGFQVMGFQPTN